ncbi:MAG: 50S ribosomal protein L10 [Chloroflexi bacterium]|nr:50S ribosomal protein L10 [Chloroflexota bacterium]
MKRLSKEKKALIIDRLQEDFSKSSVGVLTDFRGLTAVEITNLRRKLRERGIEYKVVKNTLARFAAERAGKGEVVRFLEGPVAIAFGHGEITEPAKLLVDYVRASKSSLSIKGGFLGDRALTVEEVMTLSELPSKEELISKVIGGIQSPMYALLNCLNSPVRQIIGVLQARIKQMEVG